MSKSDFHITAYLAEDEKFGSFWKKLQDEFNLTLKLVVELTGNKEMMEQYPVERRSIAIREKVVLPLVIIQHYALQQLQSMKKNDELAGIYHKLVIRTVYGIVNAGRNLA